MGFLDKAKKAAGKVSQQRQPAEDAPSAPASTDANRKVEDVLQLMQIPATFEIPADVFLPEDLKDVRFDVQVPSGYDTAQVTKFVTQARTSIRFLVELLKRRNEDVAKLATTIDRLQVDANNLRFENEIANGVSLIPTQDDADLENQLMEAQLTIRRLEDQVRSAPRVDPSGLSDQERLAYEALMDELSVERRKNMQLEDDVFHLKTRIAQMEDLQDDELDSAPPLPTPMSEDELRELGIPVAEEPVLPSVELPTPSRTFSATLPAVEETEFTSLLEDDESYPLPEWDNLGGFANVDVDEEPSLDALAQDYRDRQ